MSTIQERIDRLKVAKEALRGKTVGELLTSTANVSLAQSVGDQVAINLQSFRDLREVCMIEEVPPGVGKTVHAQFITNSVSGAFAEDAVLADTDGTYLDRSLTLAPVGANTKLSDLMKNTSAISWVEKIAKMHGGGLRMGYLNTIVDEIAGGAGLGTVTVGAKGDGVEASFSFASVESAAGAIVAGGFAPDFIASAPDKVWTCITTDYDKKLFYGGLADFMVTGKAPMIMGLDVYSEPYFETAINAGAWNGTDAEKYAIVGVKGLSAAWAQLEPNAKTTVEAVPGAVFSYVKTVHNVGASEGFVTASKAIVHAS